MGTPNELAWVLCTFLKSILYYRFVCSCCSRWTLFILGVVHFSVQISKFEQH